MGLAGVGREEGGLGVLCSIGDLEGAVGLLKGMEKGVERKDLLSGETALFQVGPGGALFLFPPFSDSFTNRSAGLVLLNYLSGF